VRHVRGDFRRSRTSTRECPDTGFGKMDCFNTSEQIVRITFDEAQNISRIFLLFEETATPRSQELFLPGCRRDNPLGRKVCDLISALRIPRRRERTSRSGSKGRRLWSYAPERSCGGGHRYRNCLSANILPPWRLLFIFPTAMPWLI
jgi:hypothetical protein